MKIWILVSVLSVGYCQLLGGWHVQDKTDPQVLWVLDSLEKQGLAAVPNGFTLTAVSGQVVAGMNYKFTYENPSGDTCEIIVFDQPWTKTLQVTLDSCKMYVTKRQLAGGLMPQDPSDQKWTDMLNSLRFTQKLVSLDSGHNVTILSVKTQVVAGVNTYFTLDVDGKTCTLVYFSQVWTNTHKITSDSCGLKAKRQMPGGWKTQDPSEQRWVDVLNALDGNKVLDLHAAGDFEVLAVQTQVVSGMNYNFTLRVHNHVCNLFIYEQPWTGTHEVKYDSCKLTRHSRRQLAGGWENQDPSEQQWTDLLNSLDTQYHKVNLAGDNFEVLAVQTQVVSGMNYKFTLRFHNHVCHVQIYVQPWTGTREVTSDTCGIKATKPQARQLPGGYFKQDASNPKYANLLQDLEQQYHLINLTRVNGMQIKDVETQVVAGMNYKFTLSVHGKTCQLVVFEQPWTNTREITYDTCGIKVARTKRLFMITSSTSSAQHKCMAAILDRINAMANSLFRLVDAQHPQTQLQISNNVVSGDFRIQVSESTCTNNRDSLGKTAEECPAQQPATIHTIWGAHCRYVADGAPEVTDLRLISH